MGMGLLTWQLNLTTPHTFGTRHLAWGWPVLKAQGTLTRGTYHSLPSPTMNYTTGAVTQTAVDTEIDMLVARFTNREIDGMTILQSDELAMFLKKDLPTDPTDRDTVTLRALEWGVKVLEETGNRSLWRVRLRREGSV